MNVQQVVAVSNALAELAARAGDLSADGVLIGHGAGRIGKEKAQLWVRGGCHRHPGEVGTVSIGGAPVLAVVLVAGHNDVSVNYRVKVVHHVGLVAVFGLGLGEGEGCEDSHKEHKLHGVRT